MINDLRSANVIKASDGHTKHLVTMELNTKYRYNCLRKQSRIDTCIEWFCELVLFGFQLGVSERCGVSIVGLCINFSFYNENMDNVVIELIVLIISKKILLH
ncbi:MAG: hypothetical protein NTZ75_07280 [Euryarchaeota archaeon]|nr:hypothetical protein [Euryarchaeota archaeon]